MSVAQSLYTGVTGLTVNSDGMAVVANNIANAGDKAYKRDRAEFEDLLSMDMTSGAGQTQIGRGARLSTVRTMHTQGGMKVTDNLTDVAIQGSGMFIVAPPGADALTSAGKLYTRAGSLHFDKDGYVANHAGYRLQGYMADTQGQLSSRLSDVRIETNTIPPKSTDKAFLNLQLDSRAKIIKEDFDLNNPEASSNFNTALHVFDSHGRAHQAVLFFRKTEADADGTSWEWHALVDNKEVSNPDDGIYKEFANGKIFFDKNGMLSKEEILESSINFSNGAFPKQKIEFLFGQKDDDSGDYRGAVSTAIAAPSMTNFHQQDGYEAGQIKALSIEQDGSIRGIFTNGIQRNLAAIALATFPNQEALMKAGKNQFMATVDSGIPNIGLPQTGTRGTLYSSSLEESNVDLGEEFVNMIMLQRLFQANSRSVTTTSDMLEELINLKR